MCPFRHMAGDYQSHHALSHTRLAEPCSSAGQSECETGCLAPPSRREGNLLPRRWRASSQFRRKRRPGPNLYSNPRTKCSAGKFFWVPVFADTLASTNALNAHERRYTKRSITQRPPLMPLTSPLDLRVPRNLTATMQLVQRLVGREHHQRYCGGVIAVERLLSFLTKMADRYPAILRNARERSYDRLRRKQAAMHMIVSAPPGLVPSAITDRVH